jgi:hypothetical protein
MSRLTYLRLALTNLRNNRRTYLPFLFASVLLTFTVYSFLMICFNPGMAQVSGGVQFMVVLEFGAVVVGLFAAVFLFYANSFLIKRRKKEMALYAVLGMEKRHVARVLTHELSLTWLVSMLAGLGLGVLLTRLLFLLIRLMMQVDVPLVGSVSPSAMTTTLILFAALFLLLILYDIWQVRAVSPAELLRGGQTGEREPRARWLPALLGIATTGAGYWIAQSVSNPLSALALFFVAVVLVIVGTYSFVPVREHRGTQAAKAPQALLLPRRALRNGVGAFVPHETERRGAGEHRHPVHDGHGHPGHDRGALQRNGKSHQRRRTPRHAHYRGQRRRAVAGRGRQRAGGGRYGRRYPE